MKRAMLGRTPATALLMLGAAVALVGCASAASAEPEPADAAAPPTDQTVELRGDEASAEQLAALSDGDVTEEEYLAAFKAYEGCLADAGYELRMEEPTGSILQFGVPEAAVESGDDRVCYELEFIGIDIAWQSALAP